MDSGISAPEYGKEVVYGINAIDRIYVCQLMSNVQLAVSIFFNSHILMNSCTHKMMSVWLNNSKNICIWIIHKHGVFDQGIYRKDSIRENGQKKRMFRIMLMLQKKM